MPESAQKAKRMQLSIKKLTQKSVPIYFQEKGPHTFGVTPQLSTTQKLWGDGGGSVSRAFDSRSKDLRFKLRQEHKKNVSFSESKMLC